MTKQEIIDKVEAYIDYSNAIQEGFNEGLITKEEFEFFFK